MNRKYIDLVNQRFDKLLVKERIGTKIAKNGHTEIMYLCSCDCGNEREVSGANLRFKRVKSCGCFAKGSSHIRNSKPIGDAAKKALYNQYKFRAKSRGYLFDLSVEQFKDITSKNCDYCDGRGVVDDD